MAEQEPQPAAGRTGGLELAAADRGNPIFAALWMLGALASFALMAVAGREISAELDTFELMFYRSLIGIAIVATIGAAMPGGLRRFRTSRAGLHGLRNLVHFIGQFCWFYSITLISLAEVFAIEFTVPIWVALLAPFFLSERMSWGRAAAVAIGFVGVLVVIRPGIASLEFGHLVMLMGAFAFSANMITTKKLSATEAPLTILFWMAVMQAPMGFIGALGDISWPTGYTWIWLGAVGTCGMTAHFCIAQAFRWADATVVAPMDFLRLPLIAFVGMTLYAEPLDLFVFLGGAIILAGNIVNIRAARR